MIKTLTINISIMKSTKHLFKPTVNIFKIQKLILIIILFTMTTTAAQESNETTEATKSEEVKALEEQRDIIKLQKEISEYQKSISDNESSLANPFDLKAMEGSTKLEGQHIESTILAYDALNEAMDKIIDSIPADNKTFILYNASMVKKFPTYYTLLIELKKFKENQKDAQDDASEILELQVNPKTNIAALPLATLAVGIYGLVESFAALGSIAKTNVEYKISDVTFSQEDLIATFVSKINGRSGLEIYAPSIFPILREISDSDSEILGEWKQIDDIITETKSILKRLKIGEADINAKIAKTKIKKEKENLQGFLEKYKKAIGNLNSHIANYDSLRTRLYAVSEGASLLSKVLDTETTLKMMTKDNARIIHLSVKAKGGSLSRQGWFVYNRMEFSGGAILQYIEFNKDGKITNAFSESAHHPFKKRSSY